MITTLCADLHHSTHVRSTGWSTTMSRKAAMDPDFPKKPLYFASFQLKKMRGALLAATLHDAAILADM